MGINLSYTITLLYCQKNSNSIIHWEKNFTIFKYTLCGVEIYLVLDLFLVFILIFTPNIHL